MAFDQKLLKIDILSETVPKLNFMLTRALVEIRNGALVYFLTFSTRFEICNSETPVSKRTPELAGVVAVIVKFFNLTATENNNGFGFSEVETT